MIKDTSTHNLTPKLRVYKSITQRYDSTVDLKELLVTFTKMINHYIKIGMRENTHNMKKLSVLCYHKLYNYDVLGSYKLCAISRAAGILSNRKQSIKRGRKVRLPMVRKPFITNCYGIKHNGCLLTIPYKNSKSINILLNNHATPVLSDPDLMVHSFSMTDTSISIYISKKVEPIGDVTAIGIDRNLDNIICGNIQKATLYKTNKLHPLSENTIHTSTGFKRNKRKTRQFWKERQERITNRCSQYLHQISNDMVDNNLELGDVIKLDKGIRKLYRSRGGQGNKHKRMNSWPFYKLQPQMKYKMPWVGLPVLDPTRTSKQCPRCGKNLQEDMQHRQKILCGNCGLFLDRDVVSAMNIYRKLPPRFRGSDISKVQSCPELVMKPRTPVVQIVDMSKSSRYGICLLSNEGWCHLHQNRKY